MTKGPRQKYRRAREAIDEQYDESEIDEATHARLGAFVDAYDGESLAVSTPSDGTNTASTLRAYARNLMRVAEDEDLVSADADDLNRLTGRMLSGEHPDIKDSGYSESTIQRYQSSLRSFYRYHDDLPVDPDDIALVETPDSPVEETDMFDSDDIQALRDACPNPRDRSFLELLINTGQRIRAIQALRVKDVDPDDGEFRLNPNVDGLKHAEGKRPLLAARAAVGDWLNYHPTGDPDDYLLTKLPNPNQVEDGEIISQNQLRRRIRQIAVVVDGWSANRAGVRYCCSHCGRYR